MKKDVAVFLNHILKSIEKIETFTKGMEKKKFLASIKTQDAVIRRLEIIGEAAKNLPKPFLSQHPEIPWSKIVRTRDKLIHGYFGIDLDITWNVVKDDIPDLKKKIKKIRDNLDEGKSK